MFKLFLFALCVLATLHCLITKLIFQERKKVLEVNWIGAYFESSTTILLIISGMMYYITYILTVTTCFGFQH